jgi:hypothetical protein
MPSSLSRGFSLVRFSQIASDPDVRFSPWVAVSRMQATQARADRRLAGDRRAEATKGVNRSQRPARAAGLVVKLSRGA